MKIRMKMSINGAFHNIDEGVVVGQVVDVPEAEAERYIALGYAEKSGGKVSEEHAVAAFSDEERAVLNTEIVGASHGAVPQSRLPRPPRVVEDEDGEVVEPEPQPEVKHEEVVDTYVNVHGESVSKMKAVKVEPEADSDAVADGPVVKAKPVAKEPVVKETAVSEAKTPVKTPVKRSYTRKA